MSNTSLCVTVLLLPPEGHINILPAPRQPRSPPQVTLIHIQRHDYTNINRLSFTDSLTVFVACPRGRLGRRTRPVPIWRLWSHAQFDFPSASLIKSSWTFLWRWERRRESNKGGRDELLPNFRRAATHCSRQVTLTCLPLSPSIFPSLASIPFFSHFLKAFHV